MTEVTVSDPMDPVRTLALAATLGRNWQPDAPLPPFAHQIHFWTIEDRGALGRDGHPAKGRFLPDLGLPRRMWAGGDLAFHAPLYAGNPAEKTSRIERTEKKTGRTGPLAFVTVLHEIRQEGRLCITERQDIVYREDPAPGAPSPIPPTAPEGAAETRDVTFTTTDLFRYSALTFNGHRIHYDLDYARAVEGYPGLVVHGPLLAQHLALMAEDALGPLRRFRFRATAPLVAGEPARLCRQGSRLWVAGADGRQCMEAGAG